MMRSNRPLTLFKKIKKTDMKKVLQNSSNQNNAINKYGRLILLLILLVPAQLFAQKKITPVPVDKSRATNLSKVFKQYSLYSINTRDIKAYAETNGKGFSEYEFDFEGYPAFPVSIYENNLLSEDYKAFSG